MTLIKKKARDLKVNYLNLTLDFYM